MGSLLLIKYFAKFFFSTKLSLLKGTSPIPSCIKTSISPCYSEKKSIFAEEISYPVKTLDTLKEYIWLVDTISQKEGISLADINEKWVKTDMSGGVPYARATFNRHKDAIQDIFGIIIDCDRKDGYKYYIGNPEVLREDSVQNWMLSTLSVSNLVSESMSLQQRIVLENIPSGGKHLRQIIHAMKEEHVITVNYHRYRSSGCNTFTLAPYCVKLFRQRWYLLGKFKNGKMVVLSIDMIESIEEHSLNFKLDESVDAYAFFSECFGVVVGDGSRAERIVLRAYGAEANYLNDLPLHHSQRIVNSTDDYTEYELMLRSTSDFKAQLLSRGAWLEVLEPQSLADELCEWHRMAILRYEKKL